MLFKSIAAIALVAATVIADATAIVNSLHIVDKDLGKLNSTLVSFHGDLFQTFPILGASTQLQHDLKAGTQAAHKSHNLTLNATVTLLSPVTKLALDASITVNTLIAKEPEFKKLGVTGIIKLMLEATKQDSLAYSNAIIVKVPASLQAYAKSLVAPINANFDRAIAAYS